MGQEIRNCIYRGPFNDLLGNLNCDRSWRRVFGKASEDKRQRDVELVLRFLALREDSRLYKKPMKDFLSAFMDRHRHDGPEPLDAVRVVFGRTMATILQTLGEKPFHIRVFRRIGGQNGGLVGHRQTHSVRVCSPPSRRVAPLRPRSAGLTAWTPAPRTPVLALV